jgi:hypothetical protein
MRYSICNTPTPAERAVAAAEVAAAYRMVDTMHSPLNRQCRMTLACAMSYMAGKLSTHGLVQQHSNLAMWCR